MSGTTDSAPVLTTMVSAVISSRSSPATTSTRLSSRKAAVPVTTVTESSESSMRKFLSRIAEVSVAVDATDAEYHACGSASSGRAEAR